MLSQILPFPQISTNLPPNVSAVSGGIASSAVSVRSTALGWPPELPAVELVTQILAFLPGINAEPDVAGTHALIHPILARKGLGRISLGSARACDNGEGEYESCNGQFPNKLLHLDLLISKPPSSLQRALVYTLYLPTTWRQVDACGAARLPMRGLSIQHSFLLLKEQLRAANGSAAKRQR
jgi:hypothetical protein